MTKKIIRKFNTGFSIIEIMIVIAILGIIMVAVDTFGVNVLNNNKYSQDALSVAEDVRKIVGTMIRELRSASRGGDGSYAIIQAATNTIVFYSDGDGDGKKEKIRYFLSAGVLKKGTIIPTGSPLSYNSTNENFQILSSNIVNGTSSPIFEYFDNNYAGTSTPLTQPVSVTQVRLVKINLLVDVDAKRSPIPRIYTSQVNLRNLKDNL